MVFSGKPESGGRQLDALQFVALFDGKRGLGYTAVWGIFLKIEEFLMGGSLVGGIFSCFFAFFMFFLCFFHVLLLFFMFFSFFPKFDLFACFETFFGDKIDLLTFSTFSSHFVSAQLLSKNQIARLELVPKEANEKMELTILQWSVKLTTRSKQNNATTRSAGVYLPRRRWVQWNPQFRLLTISL